MSIVDGRYRHGLRRMTGRSTQEHGRTATPLELLYDLTFVTAFGVAGNQLAHGIAEGHWAPAVGAFLFAMFAIIWAWINFSWFASAFDTDDWLFRLLTMVQMTGVIVLAIGLPAMFASIDHGGAIDNGVLVAGYIVMRVALIAQWLRAAKSDPEYRTVALTYAAFVGVAQVGWVLVAILPLGYIGSAVFAIVLFLIELLGPVISENRGEKKGEGATPWNGHHIAERYSLLAIIALGETVFGTLAAATEISARQGWTTDAVVVIATGIAMTFSLWWLYFLVPHGAVLAVDRRKAFPWGYGHVLLFASIAAVGAGLHVVGYAYNPEFHVDPVTVVASVAVPVLVFMIVLYLLHAWLVSMLPRNTPMQIGVLVLPVIAIFTAALGVPLWGCLLIVLASPLLLIVSFEIGAWRSLDAQLESALAARREAR